MFKNFAIFAILSNIIICCQTDSYDTNNPKESFHYAKSTYKDQSFDRAIQKLSAFRSRFPYNNHIPEVELMIANSHYELGQYTEAAAAYKNFAKLYPKNPQKGFALFRVGESYWQDSPEAENRDQTPTQKACDAWKAFIKEFPNSPYTPKAKKLLIECDKRIANSMKFVASFYCKQDLWHSCAYKYEKIIKRFPKDKQLIKESLIKGAYALEKMLESKKNSDENIYYRKMTDQEIQNKAVRMRRQSESM